MRVFIQIVCLNRRGLSAVLSSIPVQIDGVDESEILVIDDGSSDRTIGVARAHGVTHFVHHTGPWAWPDPLGKAWTTHRRSRTSRRPRSRCSASAAMS